MYQCRLDNGRYIHFINELIRNIYRCDQGLDGKGHLRMGKLHLVDLAVSIQL